MANTWFRMHHEFDSDPKVQSMPEVMQRRLVMLFCARCKSETLHETERAFHWRISPQELAETKSLFRDKGFIDDDWNLLNWNKRQFLSDSSTDRVRRYRRALKHDETLHETDETKMKHSMSVTVTPPDTDTDTDTEQKSTSPKQTPTEIITADMVVRAVLVDLRLSGDRLHYTLAEIAGQEIASGVSPQEIRDKLIAAWREYDASAGKLEYHCKPATFFGDGRWRNKASWGWKKGMEGTAPVRKYANA